MEFSIPISFADLKTKRHPNDYSVSDVISARLLPTKIAELRSDLKQFEHSTVLTHFDTLYSVLCAENDQENTTLESAWSCLLKCLGKLYEALDGNCVKMADSSLRTSLSMSIYLTTEYVDRLETLSNKPTTEQIVAGKKKGKRKVESADNMSVDWTVERCKSVKCMTKLMSLPVQRLWEPPVVDQNLINCIGSCCFKLLHNPVTAKLKDTKEEIFHLIGILVKRHKYSLSAAVQALESMKSFEHMASTMAECLSVITREFSFPRTAQDLIREISSLSADYLQKDSVAAKSYSVFLTEVADLMPDVLLPLISLLLPLLESDPFSLRNAMLSVLGKLITNVLTGDELNANQKKMREEFIDSLCEHVHDCHGFVRSKVLQVITSLVDSLPVTRYSEVGQLTLGRLNDRLPNVRKYALQLLTTLISHNPYGATLTDKELVETLESETSKLAEFKSRAQRTLTAVISPAEIWEAMLPETVSAVEECLRENSEKLEDDCVVLESDATVDSVKEDINKLLTDCRQSKAVQLLLQSQQVFAGSELELSPSEEDHMEEEDNSQLEGNSQLILDKLKAIFLSQKVPESSAEEQMSEDGDELKELMRKQEVVVNYLRETYKFCDLIRSAMPTVCILLCSKHSSDVVESIKFVVMSVQFGVTDAMNGLASMLKLIWSEDSNIKLAVVEAFKSLYILSDSETGDVKRAPQVVASLIGLTKAFGELYGLLTSWEEMVAEFVRSEAIGSQVLQLLWQSFTKKLDSTTDSDSKLSLQLLAMAAKARPGIISSNLDILLADGLGERATRDFLLARDVCFALLTLPSKGTLLPADHNIVTSLSRLLTEGILDTTQSGWIPLMEQAVTFIYHLTDVPDETVTQIVKETYSLVTSRQNILLLTRFVCLIGHVALRQLTYLEGRVLVELKARRKRQKQKTIETTTGSSSDELGQTTTDDLETEVIMKVIETELLRECSLLGSFLPLLTHIIQERQRYDDRGLQAAATLSLGKFMLLSSDICRQHLRLFFTVLERSSYVEVKTNAIVALSDMVFRHPNELEPWTPNLYARLRDESPLVRRSTLMVMTRLILNDMVKVKGQISEIARCLVDPEHAIRRMAEQFFCELANKGRALYNVLLDIVSRLSDPQIGVTDEQFQTVCTELFSHTNNDKQSESLIERFLHRFRATTDERQWRHISFCLSRLTYTERSVKKLLELFSCYSDKLADEQIYELFMVIVDKANQKLKPKPGAKELILELSAKIEVAHTKGIDGEEELEDATVLGLSQSNISLAKGRRKRSSRAKKRNKENSSQSQYSDDDSDDSTCSRLSVSSVSQETGVRRSTRRTGAVKPSQKLLTELIEESEEEDAVPNFIRSAQKPKSSKPKLILSSSDEDEVSAEAVISPAPFQRRPLRQRNKS